MSESEIFMKNMKPTTTRFDHQSLIDELDGLNHQLEEMKEKVMKSSVRAHILEADIATLFDPEVAGALETANEKCETCTKLLDADNQCKQ